MEGLLALPKLRASLSKLIRPEEVEIASCKQALQTLCRERRAHNIFDSKLNPESFIRDRQTQELLGRIEDEQPGDIIIVRVQCGLCYRDKSMEQVGTLLEEGEFGFGLREVLWLLYLSPRRLQKFTDLGMDAMGNRYVHSAEGEWAPCVNVSQNGSGAIEIAARRTSAASPAFGAVTGRAL